MLILTRHENQQKIRFLFLLSFFFVLWQKWTSIIVYVILVYILFTWHFKNIICYLWQHHTMRWGWLRTHFIFKVVWWIFFFFGNDFWNGKSWFDKFYQKNFMHKFFLIFFQFFKAILTLRIFGINPEKSLKNS